jgi:hypothetical protein
MAKQAVKAGGHGKAMAPYKSENEKDVTFAKGGDTPMFGHMAANEKQEGITGKSTAGAGGGDKFASGGSNKMFGYAPSYPAKAGQTGAR